MPVPDTATCSLRHTLFDRYAENTLHFRNLSPPNSPLRLANLAGFVGAWWADNILPWLSFDLQYLMARAQDISVAGGDFVDDVSFSGSGGTVRNALPASVAPVVSFSTATTSMITRNRNYLVGIPDTAVIGNRLHPEWWPHIIEGYDALIDLASAQQWRWVGVHRFVGSTPLSEGVVGRVDHARFLRYTVGQRRKRLHNEFLP